MYSSKYHYQTQFAKINHWLILIFVLILVLLWNDGLKLKAFDLTGGSKTEWSKNYVVFALIGATVFLRLVSPRRLLKSWYLKSLFVLAIIVLCPIIFTSIRTYDQPLSILWRRPFLFGAYLIFPFLILADLSRKEVVRLFYVILAIPAIGNLLCGIGYFFPDIYNLFVDWEVSSRFGLFRLYIAPDFTKLLFFFLIAKLIDSKSAATKMVCTGSVFLLLWIFVNIWLTRQVVYGVLGGILIVWFIRTKPQQKLITVLVAVLIIALITSLEQLQIETYVLRNLSLMNELTTAELTSTSGTLGNRLFGLEYYYKLFQQTNFIGLGMNVSESMFDPISKGGWQYQYNINDLGLMGMIFCFGIPVPIFLFIMFKRLYRDLSSVVSSHDGDLKVIADAILMYFLGEVAGLVFTKAFFYAKSAFFYGLLIYFVWRFMQPDIAPLPQVKETSQSRAPATHENHFGRCISRIGA